MYISGLLPGDSSAPGIIILLGSPRSYDRQLFHGVLSCYVRTRTYVPAQIRALRDKLHVHTHTHTDRQTDIYIYISQKRYFLFQIPACLLTPDLGTVRIGRIKRSDRILYMVKLFPLNFPLFNEQPNTPRALPRSACSPVLTVRSINPSTRTAKSMMLGLQCF